jgi:hypothetical protein
MSPGSLKSLEQATVSPVAVTPVLVPPISPEVTRLVILGSAAVVGIALLMYLRSKRG